MHLFFGSEKREENMLKVSDLVKRKGEQILLSGISFEVKNGEIFGLIGPNGAGKTTVLRTVAGLSRPDYGEVYLDNMPIYQRPWPRKPLIGYVPEQFGSYENISIEEFVSFYAATHGAEGKKLEFQTQKALDFTGLTDLRTEDASRLGVDEQKFLALAAVLAGNPRLLVLDEPTTGMDPGHRQNYIQLIRTLSEEGMAILLSSHMLSDLDQICHSIAIINHGVIVRNGRADHILLEADQDNPIQIQVLGETERAAAVLRKNPDVVRMTMDETRIAVWFSGDRTHEAELLGELIREKIPVISFTREKKNLESLFFHITDEKNE